MSQRNKSKTPGSRRPKDEPPAKSVRVQAVIEHELFEWLESAATSSGRTISNYLRLLVMNARAEGDASQ